jgi:hypothetical protein
MLIVSAAEALPYQLIGLQLENGQPKDVNSKTVVLKVGDSTVVAYRTSNNDIFAYFFQLPELATGVYNLSMETVTGEARAEIIVKPYTPIVDVNKYIADYKTRLNNQYSQISQEYDIKVQEGDVRQGTADSLKDFVKKAYDKSAALLAQLPDIEKKKFAYIYEANKQWLEDFKIAIGLCPLVLSSKRSGDPCESVRRSYNVYLQGSGSEEWKNHYKQKLQECEAKQEQARLEAEKTFNGKINAAYTNARAELDKTPGKISGGLAFVSAYVAEAAKGIFETITGIEDVDDPFAPVEMDDPKKRSVLTFTADKENHLSASVTFTNLNRQNVSLSPAFTEMISSIDYHNQTMENIGQFLPYKANMEVPAEKTEQIYLQDYTIDQISNPNISVQITDDIIGRKVKFTPKNITAPETNFTFHINVKTAYGEVTKTIEATLELPLDKVLISGSPWKLIGFEVDGEDYFKSQKRGNSFCNNVEYFEYSKILNATMSFMNNYVGSFSGNVEIQYPIFSYSGNNCYYLGMETKTESENQGLNWTFNQTTNIIKIPELVNDDVDEYKVTYDKGIITLISLYNSIRLQKP